MFIATKKLYNFKKVLILWQRSKPYISARIDFTKSNLDRIQTLIRSSAPSEALIGEEYRARIFLFDCILSEESMLKQKSRDKHLNLGDCNSNYFYSIFKAKKRRASISCITDGEGLSFPDSEHIESVFVEHVLNILAPAKNQSSSSNDLDLINVSHMLDQDEVDTLCSPLKLVEIVDAIKYNSSHKSPGSDRFIAFFFKICWPIIKRDISAAIMDFFKERKLLKQVKNNFLALIPKIEVCFPCRLSSNLSCQRIVQNH